MDKRIFVAVILVSSVLVLAILPSASCAASAKVGVRARSTAEYSIHKITHVYGTDVSSGQPVHFYYNVTEPYDKLRVFVSEVAGTMVTLNLSLYLPNRTVYRNGLVSGNVSSEIWDFFWPPVQGELLIMPNLSVGDPIYQRTSQTCPYLVNETIMMTVTGKLMLVNHVEMGIGYNAYWVKSSGLLVELRALMRVVVDGDYGGRTEYHWLNVSLTSQNIGEQIDVENQIMMLSIGGVTLVTMIAIFVFVDRRKHT